MRLNESKFFQILTITMLCCVLGILVFGGIYGFAAAVFEDTIIELITEKIFLFDLLLSVVLFFVFLFIVMVNANKQAEHVADLNEASEEFEVLYEKLKEECLKDFERARKILWIRKIIEKVLQIGTVASIFMYAALMPVVYVARHVFIPLSLFVIIAFFFIYKSNKKYIANFEKEYKGTVLNAMIKNMGYNSIKFIPTSPERELVLDEMYKSLYPTPQNERIDYKNFIDGLLYSDLELKFTDMYLSKVTYGRSRIPNVYFSGYFGYMEFRRNIFNSFSIVKKGTYKQKEIVRDTNNEYFDKHFVLKSNNERFKAGLIRDGIADAVARFYSATNIELQITTRGEKVFFKIFSSSIFEPHFSNNYKERVYTQYYFLNELFILIEEIYEIIKYNSY